MLFHRSHAPAWERIPTKSVSNTLSGYIFSLHRASAFPDRPICAPVIHSSSLASTWGRTAAKNMGRSRYKITSPELPHFITSTVLHWIPVFTRPATVDILLKSMRYLMADGLKIYAYVILENHLHMAVQSNELNRDIARFKSFTAKQLIHHLDTHNIKPVLEQLAFYRKAHKGDRAYQFWQEGVHPELLQNAAIMRQKIEYIHQNPVKRGYVDNAMHWRYSSARNYAGLEGLLDVCMDW